MGQWSLSVVAVSLLSAIILNFLPEGRISGFAKPLISLIAVIIVASPFFFPSKNLDFNLNYSPSVAVETDEEFLSYIVSSKIDLYRLNCIKIAENNDIKGAEFEIEYTVNEEYAITFSGLTINLQNAVISSSYEHIVIMQRLKDEIGDYLGVDVSCVKISGEDYE